MKLRRLLVITVASTVVSAASAASAEICAVDAICASDPGGVVKAVQDAGYKAALKKDDKGLPWIDTAAAGYNYEIDFLDCNNGVNCASLAFMMTMSKDASFSAELANLWNKDKRFSTMSYDPAKGTMLLEYDVTTAGGLNKKNFADVLDWWNTMLGNADRFFREHPAAKTAS